MQILLVSTIDLCTIYIFKIKMASPLFQYTVFPEAWGDDISRNYRPICRVIIQIKVEMYLVSSGNVRPLHLINQDSQVEPIIAYFLSLKNSTISYFGC